MKEGSDASLATAELAAELAALTASVAASEAELRRSSCSARAKAALQPRAKRAVVRMLSNGTHARECS